MKVVCKVCGREQEVVDSIDKLEGTPKRKRWMMLTFMRPGDHGVICGGGIFRELRGEEFDGCLARLIMRHGEQKFRLFNDIEVFFPVEGLVPEGAMP